MAGTFISAHQDGDLVWGEHFWVPTTSTTREWWGWDGPVLRSGGVVAPSFWRLLLALPVSTLATISTPRGVVGW